LICQNNNNNNNNNPSDSARLLPSSFLATAPTRTATH